ncbi:MAG: RtcB family protein, partial [Richelia sp. SM1_7_0]|nr:RtcB family protein [Richelia sp. SM1_7_0]
MPYKELEISTETPVLSWANHELKSDETKWLKRGIATFVFKHVALMP